MNHAETLVTAALRSGEYEQGSGTLRRANEHDDRSTWCCLGVATEIYRRETGNGTWAEDGDPETRIVPFILGRTINRAGLPDPVREWLDWETSRGPTPALELAHLNDGGVPFHEIADIIEHHRKEGSMSLEFVKQTETFRPGQVGEVYRRGEQYFWVSTVPDIGGPDLKPDERAVIGVASMAGALMGETLATSGEETMAFKCDSEGHVEDWMDVAVACGAGSREVVLDQLREGVGLR